MEESNIAAIQKLTDINQEIVQRNFEREDKFRKDM